LLVPALLTVVIGLVVAFALSADPGTADPLFAESLREQTMELRGEATGFQVMLDEMAGVDRVQLETSVDEVTAVIEATREQIDTVPAEDPELAGPIAILGEALNAWEAGVTGFQEVVLTAADDALVPVVDLELGLTDALVDLRAGDRVFGAFVESVGRLEDVPQAVAAFPDVDFVPADYPLAARSAAIIASARSPQNSLALRAELAIDQVATVPEMVVNTNDERVVTTTEALTVRVVVVNRGNTESSPIELSMIMVGADGTEVPGTMPVAALPADSPTTVEFVDLPVTPGNQYTLTVPLPLSAGEEESEDNLRSFTFRVNDVTETTATAGQG
jgi:hypothetical protein